MRWASRWSCMMHALRWDCRWNHAWCNATWQDDDARCVIGGQLDCPSVWMEALLVWSTNGLLHRPLQFLLYLLLLFGAEQHAWPWGHEVVVGGNSSLDPLVRWSVASCGENLTEIWSAAATRNCSCCHCDMHGDRSMRRRRHGMAVNASSIYVLQTTASFEAIYTWCRWHA
jgi:hypothetical protein